MINLNTYRKILNSCNDIQQICSPLFELLNAHGFTIQRMYKDGGRFYYSNSPKWVENFFNKNYLLASSFRKFSRLETFTLWKHWPREDNAFHSLMHDARENFNYDNGIVIIRSYEDYMDVYTIRGYNETDIINNMYLNYYAYINKFLDYFELKASDLINSAEKNKIFISEDEVIADNIPLSCYKKEQFLDSLQSAESYSRSKANRLMINSTTFLAPQESECLTRLVKGMTVKQIAKDLHLSPRTVEGYLRNIKMKTNCYSRTELIKYITKFKVNKFLIFDGE
jgi:DNA-binding CsgD family transcriptional regulator